MRNLQTYEEFLNESSKFIVGKNYIHPKFGKFTVIELSRDSKTKVKFLEGRSKGDISYIAGYEDEGYLKESEEALNESNIISMKSISDIDHTRLIKWIGQNLKSDVDVVKSKDGFTIDASKIPNRDKNDLMKYLKSSDYLNESSLNEDAMTAILMLQAAMVGGQIAMLANRVDFHPIDDLKTWWKEHWRDKAVQSILDKLKDDQDVIEFLQLPKAKQEGQWKKLISPKLTADELKYINSVSRDRVKSGKL